MAIIRELLSLLNMFFLMTHSGKAGTIRESNQASGVRKAHYAKSLISRINEVYVFFNKISHY